MGEICPRCKSTKTRVVEASYPKAYECMKCGFVFVKVPKMLIDDQ